MTEKKFTFTVELSAYGETIDQAWEAAYEGFVMDSGPARAEDVTELCVVCPNCQMDNDVSEEKMYGEHEFCCWKCDIEFTAECLPKEDQPAK